MTTGQYVLAYIAIGFFMAGVLGMEKIRGKREANEASRVAIVRPVAIFAGLVNLVMVFGGWIRYNLLWKTEDEKAWLKLSKESIQPDVT